MREEMKKASGTQKKFSNNACTASTVFFLEILFLRDSFDLVFNDLFGCILLQCEQQTIKKLILMLDNASKLYRMTAQRSSMHECHACAVEKVFILVLR